MTKVILAFMSAALLLAACSKKSSGSGSGSGGSTDMVKSITTTLKAPSGTSTSVNTFVYDSQNRPIQSISGPDTAYYTYTANTLTSVGEGFMTVYFLNASGTADSAYQAYDVPGIAAGVTNPLSNGTFVYYYTYSSNGYLARTYQYQVSPVGDTVVAAYLYTVTNGNITEVTDSVSVTSTPLTYTNQTTTTHPLPPDPFAGAVLPFGPSAPTNLFGHPNANLIATIPETIGTLSNTIKVTYTLDGQGRIATVTEDTPAGLLAPSISTYLYY